MHLIRRSKIILAATAVATAATVFPAAAAPAGVSTGQLIQLGSLGGRESLGGSMNERGDMTGASVDAGNNWQAVVWLHGRRFPTALGVARASAGAISDSGHILGRVWEGGTLFVWRHGSVTYLPKIAGYDLEAAAVNDRAQVVGTAYEQNSPSRALLWQRGRFTILPTPKGADSRAVGINNRGQIIGVVKPRDIDTEQAVLWQSGKMIKLGTLGGAASTPVAINSHGQVIGNSTVSESGDEHPFLWQRGRMTDLLAGTTATGGRVFDLNDTGMMTGFARWGSGHSQAVLWRGGRMIDLGVPGGAGLGSAVNDRGDVAGLTWMQTEGFAVPFRWRHGRTTLFPDPVPDIAIRVVGIDRHGTIGVEQETSARGIVLLRSA